MEQHERAREEVSTEDRESGDPHSEVAPLAELETLQPGTPVVLSLRVINGADELPMRAIAEACTYVEYLYDLALWVEDPYVFEKDIPEFNMIRPRSTPRPFPGYELRVKQVHYGSGPNFALSLTAAVAASLATILAPLAHLIEVMASVDPPRVRKAKNDAKELEYRVEEAKFREQLDSINRRIQDRSGTDRPAALAGKAPRSRHERREVAAKEGENAGRWISKIVEDTPVPPAEFPRPKSADED